MVGRKRGEDQKGKVSGGKGPGQENPRNRASEHVHNISGGTKDVNGVAHVFCTCGQDMGTA